MSASRNLVFCVHATFPPYGLDQSVRPRLEAARSCDFPIAGVDDREKSAGLSVMLADGIGAARSSERRCRHIPFPGQLSQQAM